MTPEEFQQVTEGMSAAFVPERAKGIDAVIQIESKGDNFLFLTIRDQKLSFSEGKAANPRLTLKASQADLIAIFQRKLDPTSAYFQGRLVVEGDISLAMRLPGLFQ